MRGGGGKCSAAAFVAILAAWEVLSCAALVNAGSVRMRDGRMIEGELRFAEKQLTITPPGGQESTIDLASLAAVRFKEAEPTGAGASVKPITSGLRGEYCTDTQFKDVRLVRVDQEISFNWTEDAPPDRALGREYSVRWTGQIEAPQAEVYTFHLRVLGGGWLWINNQLVVGRMQGSDGTFTGNIALKPGRKYDLKLEFHAKGLAKCRLQWSRAGQQPQFVSAASLSLPPGMTAPLARISSPIQGSRLGALENSLEVSGSEDLRAVEFYCDDRSIGVAQSAPWRLQWKNAPVGEHRIQARATNSAGISVMTPVVNIAIVPRTEALPSPWSAAANQRHVARAISYADGAFTLRSAGCEMFGEHERFEFVYQSLSGDGTIVARMSAFDSGGGPAWAGIIIREHTRPEKAKAAFLGFMPDVGLVFAWRDEVWKPAGSIEEKKAPPMWLKLVRYGPLIKAYRSADGNSWRALAEHQVKMEQDVCVGLLVACTSREGGSATFDNISVTRGSPQLATTAKGVILRSGSLIAGNLGAMDRTSARIYRSSETIVPTAQVARILFRPMTAESAARIEKRTSGVLLGNGDFVDGKLESFEGGNVRISSVLLGSRRYGTWEGDAGGAAAAVLREITPSDCAYEIRGTDGSLFKAKSIEIDKGRLKATDAFDVSISFDPAELVEISTQGKR